MIIGIGVDLVNIDRIKTSIEKFGLKFKERIFTANECEYAELRRYKERTYANRFAAKEACAKALGTGFANSIQWTDIEVINESSGQPNIKLHGKALETFEKLIPNDHCGVIHLSISDEPPYSKAFVIISAVGK